MRQGCAEHGADGLQNELSGLTVKDLQALASGEGLPQKEVGGLLAKDELIAKLRARLVPAGVAAWRGLIGGMHRVKVFILVLVSLLDSMLSMSGSQFFIFGSYTVTR